MNSALSVAIPALQEKKIDFSALFIPKALFNDTLFTGPEISHL
jgi:hypothetical protein